MNVEKLTEETLEAKAEEWAKEFQEEEAFLEMKVTLSNGAQSSRVRAEGTPVNLAFMIALLFKDEANEPLKAIFEAALEAIQKVKE